MERSSIVHLMDERFSYKLAEHRYIIKLITKKDDLVRVRLAYLEKYFREKDMPLPSETFYVDMKKVASSEHNDYYEAEISDRILLTGIKDKIKEYTKTHSVLNPFVLKAVQDVKKREGTLVTMLSLAYYFVLESKQGTCYYGNYKFFANEPHADVLDMFNMVFHQADVSCFQTPEWSKGAVVYQIFPERFAPTDGVFSKQWFNEPMTFNVRTNGTLKGITQKIPYLKELGVDAIYLTPIFLANSYHRYDTVDYREIDPLLGGNQAFKELVQTLHQNGIRVILDLVFNHTATNFFAFRDLLEKQERSAYKDWYFIEKFPVEMKIPSDYLGFSFSPGMPKLNTSNKECRQYLFDVSAHYLREYGIDGYRLDVANEIPYEFWREFRKLCKSIKPDCLIMGECWYDARTFLQGEQFDSIMNYTYYDAIKGVLTQKYTTAEFTSILAHERGETSLTYYHNSNLLVGSHDTERIYRALNGDERKFRLAMAMLFTLPGSPILYYGDEKMMDGDKDPDCRRGMIFDENYHADSFAFVKRMIALKHLPCMRIGEMLLSSQDDCMTITRSHEGRSLSLVMNFSDEERFVPSCQGKQDLITQTVFNGTLPPWGLLIWEV